jgi:hypothetical protein
LLVNELLASRTWKLQPSSWNASLERNEAGEKLDVVFLNLGIYNDEFGWLGGGKKTKKQLVYLLTTGEIHESVRNHSNSLAILILMLARSKDVGIVGKNRILELFTAELRELASGIYVSG